MRVLVVGAGVIGSVYAGRLIDEGHSVTLCARGHRLDELHQSGLILENTQTGQRTRHEVDALQIPAADTAYDVALVAVRHDQMLPALPLLANLAADVVFFGNAAGLTDQLSDALGDRALFGFPAAGGVREGPVVRYVLIRQQKTMLADTVDRSSPRIRALAATFGAAGFPTHVSADAEAWLTAHAAFIVPIGFALYRVDVQPARLAADRELLATMVRATRQGFRALQAIGNTEIPRNLRVLYQWLPLGFAVRYWHATLAGPRGELWFAGHTRAAPEEMASLAEALRAAVHRGGRPAPDLEALVGERLR